MNFRNFTFPQEPAIYVGAANAIILLVVSFGLPVTVDQKVAIDGVIGTLGVLLGAILVRQNVTPVASPPSPPPPTPPTPPEPPHG